MRAKGHRALIEDAEVGIAEGSRIWHRPPASPLITLRVGAKKDIEHILEEVGMRLQPMGPAYGLLENR